MHYGRVMRFKYSFRVCFLLLIGLVSQAAAQETKLKWLGHAAFSITTPKGNVLLIDPWIRNPSNPEAGEGKDPFAAISRVDYILLTHGDREENWSRANRQSRVSLQPGKADRFHCEAS